jgi:leucyl-tRNA synthetase
LFEENKNLSKNVSSASKLSMNELSAGEKEVYQLVNKSLSKFEVEIENFRFNTAVATLMELNNGLKELANHSEAIKIYTLERFVTMLAPLAPHMAEECWSILGNDKGLFDNPIWFEVDKDALVQDTVTVVVQVNGKVRTKFDLQLDTPEAEVKKLAWEDAKVITHTNDKTVVKEIYIKNKIYNIVVR